MAVSTAKGLFNEHFVSHASATWNDLKNGAESSITKADLSGNLWNALVCSTPVIAGGGVAYAINLYAHTHWVVKGRFKFVPSLLFTTISCIAGATVSFIAIRVLSANNVNLSSFTADKAICLATLNMGMLAATIPISTFFGIPLQRSFNALLYLGATAAVSGYFGKRSLSVIGALSALFFAVTASLPGKKEDEKLTKSKA